MQLLVGTIEASAGEHLRNSPGEFAEVVRNHWSRIFRYLQATMRDTEMAEVLTQECFLKAFRAWSTFRGDSSTTTWLMRIAMNLQKDVWRSRRMQFWRETQANSIDVGEVSTWLASRESSPYRQLEAREQLRQVWEVVGRLGTKQKTVLLLRYVEELEFHEIAATTGMRIGTVKAHLSRALQKVRSEFQCREEPAAKLTREECRRTHPHCPRSVVDAKRVGSDRAISTFSNRASR